MTPGKYLKDKNKLRVAIIGKGNVGSHLALALDEKVDLDLYDSRKPIEFENKPDIILITVSDSAIVEIARKIKSPGSIIAHTSGSTPMEILKDINEKYGVFYPLQTFTKGINLDYSEIPFFIEGSTPEVTQNLKKLASLISSEVKDANSEQRKNLHLASVFACNFTNALMGISNDILEKNDIDKKFLLPLLKQTLKKLETLNAEEAQTGPAVRNDISTMERHLEMLEKNGPEGKIYEEISQYIMKKNTEYQRRKDI